MNVAANPAARFVEGVEVASTAFEWSATHIDSTGGSGSVLLTDGARSAFVKQVRHPSQWSNELHVLWPGHWRKTQVAAYLDDGTFYAAYGKREHAPHAAWREANAVAGVVVTLDEAHNTAAVAFFRDAALTHTIAVTGDAHRHVRQLRIEVRVHPNGAVTLLDR